MLVTRQFTTEPQEQLDGVTLGLYAGTDCVAATDYFSYLATPSILFQTPAVYEILVWDSVGDGSGAGSGGEIIFDPVGTNGAIQNNPSGLRMVSLVSTEQLATFQLNAVAGDRVLPLCSGRAACKLWCNGYLY